MAGSRFDDVVADESLSACPSPPRRSRTEPHSSNVDAAARTTAASAPSVAGTAFTEAIMAMPAAAVALTRAMAGMYLGKTVGYPIPQAGYLADIRRNGADHTGGHGKQAGRSQNLKRFGHFLLPNPTPEVLSFNDEDLSFNDEERKPLARTPFRLSAIA
jgi:hypothetical protein